jgi:hypothetical protein
MDLPATLKELYTERARIIRLMNELSELYSPAGIERREQHRRRVEERILKKRGRKAMSAEERLEVSARMRNYWAGRKAAKLTLESSVT